tara:strand:- start:8519 stop:9031 length:513 start_codon:yes stop_codon:yes gene_type:complete
MVLNFKHKLQEALNQIDHQETKEFIIHPHQAERTLANTDDILENYADAKQEILNLINHHYKTNFNHDNWLNNKPDEVAHFINEAGSNTLNYSEFKTPHKFYLYLGNKGFVIAIEQLGQPFNAQHIHANNIKQNEGKAFTFFRNTESTIFFNDAEETKIAYLLYITSLDPT